MYVFTRQIFGMYRTVADRRRGRGPNGHVLFSFEISSESGLAELVANRFDAFFPFASLSLSNWLFPYISTFSRASARRA